MAHGHHGHGVKGHAFATEFFNPATPVSVPVRGFQQGARLRLVMIPTGVGRFVINLKRPGDIALHYNPRFDEKAVVRNSTLRGGWQSEERSCEPFPFHANRIYTLEFVAEPGAVAVFINGQHHCRFNERGSHHDINEIEVGGNVHIHSVHLTS
ncbi:unnamed protein product, partial [Mesorhabditis belari]|uniref:Galectin n=1 Tax=Mesorhabditis belari TaxID=2138241 RepID=A0AAF3E915_9BILA